MERKEPDLALLGGPFLVWTMVHETYQVGMDAAILRDNVKTRLADLKEGSHVSLLFGPDDKTVVRISADGGTVRGRFVSSNEVRNTIAVLVGKKDERRIYHLLKETEVITEGGTASGVKDLRDNTPVLLTLSAEDANTVIRIEPAPHEKKEDE